MAVWSPVGDTLYFEKTGDTWRWTPSGGAQMFLSKVKWIDPTVSPNGRYIAYTVRGSNGSASVHLMDITSGSAGTAIGHGVRSLAAFLTNDLLFLRSDLRGCFGQLSSYIYDVRDHTEVASSIDSVQATWPATSANGG